ncbi:MAG: nascent polypeptide-associated complex protein [Methanothrix sp.]|nr:nascent polypeptide-associated complex protein [Methanothrix sp.]
MSPRKMKGMLKSMGIDIDELENVLEVVIRMPDKEIVIANPSVAVMDSHGVRSYQISGDVTERSVSLEEPVLDIPDSDVELVVAQTGVKAEDAKAALLEAKGDLAAAIMKLGAK